MAATVTVRLPDGSARELATGSTAGDLAAAIGSGLARAAVAAVVDGREVDLSTELADGDEVAILTTSSDAGREVLRH
ncbi:MAG TPA: TGS domain-containing protein, partial [Acidimicrobiales bacterium]|nr:TGS domain-containing protein [Acidimicrobiales bacterium]